MSFAQTGNDRPAQSGALRLIAYAPHVFLLGAFAALGYTIADYSIDWMHPETWAQHNVYLAGLNTFDWSLPAQFFNCEIIAGGGCTRARFLSYLFSYANAFFRLWLVDYIPPHPSLSLNWLFSLASIYFLYRIVLGLTHDRPAALLASGLYILSAGLLSNFSMLFHPAKPLAGFFVNLCLLLALRLERAAHPAGAAAYATLLFPCLWLAYFSDETTWFLWVAIPILCPRLAIGPRRVLLAGIVSSFPLFLAFVTWAAPVIVKSLWGYEFTFWSYIFNSGATEPNAMPLLERIEPGVILAVALNLVTSQHAWWQSGRDVAVLSLLPVAAAVGLAGIFADRALRVLLLRASALFAAFLVFQSVLLLRYIPASEAGTFYYGALYANYSAILAGVVMACFRGGWLILALRAIAAVYLGFVSFTWCLSFNTVWIPMHFPDHLQIAGRNLRPDAPSSAGVVAEYWSIARAGGDAGRIALQPKEVWLFDLMDDWRRRQSAQ